MLLLLLLLLLSLSVSPSHFEEWERGGEEYSVFLLDKSFDIHLLFISTKYFGVVAVVAAVAAVVLSFFLFFWIPG